MGHLQHSYATGPSYFSQQPPFKLHIPVENSRMDQGKEDGEVNREKTHDNETHGTSDDIDEKTPIDKVKGPNLFERAKEEIEALVEAVHPKKEKVDKNEK
ncbi:uncharacterized protein LOC110037956 [Phalaenopsis equestris]|uniref:uncharacterized protein LOC110037956 n=1 Tax=Phalaenopsis equestris TaxID=78828 RepID=UPI0009E347EC|nr:uncharacterized protein LOC110037956 [Phalaenopsis equestris]